MEPSMVLELSETASSGCCKVCAKPEQEDKRFLICGNSLCPYKYFHIRCLTVKQIASDAQRNKPCWYCPACLCRVCLVDKDDDQVILCDGCDEAYHLYCLSPARTSVPVEEWLCSSCTEEKARERTAREFENVILSLHRKDGAMVRSGNPAMNILLYAVEELSNDEHLVSGKVTLKRSEAS